MAEVQDRHRVAAQRCGEPLAEAITVAEEVDIVAHALADQEAVFIAWLKNGAPRPGTDDGGSYEEDIDDTLDNMVAAVESGCLVGQSDQVTFTSDIPTEEAEK